MLTCKKRRRYSRERASQSLEVIQIIYSPPQVIQGDIEALKAENTAAFAGVQSSLENAQATADRDEADILQAEGDLWFLANETMGHLGEFMNVSGTQIETFQARLKQS